jgi:hypothetical protein
VRPSLRKTRKISPTSPEGAGRPFADKAEERTLVIKAQGF